MIGPARASNPDSPITVTRQRVPWRYQQRHRGRLEKDVSFVLKLHMWMTIMARNYLLQWHIPWVALLICRLMQLLDCGVQHTAIHTKAWYCHCTSTSIAQSVCREQVTRWEGCLHTGRLCKKHLLWVLQFVSHTVILVLYVACELANVAVRFAALEYSHAVLIWFIYVFFVLHKSVVHKTLHFTVC